MGSPPYEGAPAMTAADLLARIIVAHERIELLPGKPGARDAG
jgi:hypothetical protein